MLFYFLTDSEQQLVDYWVSESESWLDIMSFLRTKSKVKVSLLDMMCNNVSAPWQTAAWQTYSCNI